MKIAALMTVAFLATGGMAMAQSNATVEGTKTAPSNGSGAPSAASPTGQVSTSTVAPVAGGGTATTSPAK